MTFEEWWEKADIHELFKEGAEQGWNAAYREGMMRGAEIAEEHHVGSYDPDGNGFSEWDYDIHVEDAIRSEANNE
jgi:hypothetical protein